MPRPRQSSFTIASRSTARESALLHEGIVERRRFELTAST